MTGSGSSSAGNRKTTWKLKLANVILRDPANWWRTAQIDLGSRDGVQVNLPVLTPDGLVGRILTVGLTRSQVVLLGDPNCKVSALVENDTRNMGIVESAGPFDGSLLTLDYLSKDATLKPGRERRLQRPRRHFSEGNPDRKNRRLAPGRGRLLHRGPRPAGRQSQRAGGSVGAVPMNTLNSILLLLATFLAVFWEGRFGGVRHLLGAQVDLLPALVVYAGLCSGLTTMTLRGGHGGIAF